MDGDDHNDPVADAIRGTLDGHIVLDRSIANEGRFPAVNVLASISRLAELAWTPEQRELIRRLRALIAKFEDTRDLRQMGGYTPAPIPNWTGRDHDTPDLRGAAPEHGRTAQQGRLSRNSRGPCRARDRVRGRCIHQIQPI